MFLTENVTAALLSLPMELERAGSKIAAGLAEFHNGQRIDGARPVQVRPGVVWGGSCRVVGWSLRPLDASATVTLRNGRDDSDDPVAVVDFAGGAAETQWLGPAGIAVGEALFATVTGAGVEGVVYLGVVD